MAISAIDKWFKITERGSDIFTELQAGMITFMTLSYILAINANILTMSGGTCDLEATDAAACLTTLKKDMVIATAVSSGVATLLMGIWANMPLGLAPGMGMNAYFTYTVVGFMGSGNLSYESALTCVFLEGIIFIILALTGIRLYIAKLIPKQIMFATTVGIGLFLAILGLQPREGIGMIVGDPITGITLGGCGHPDVNAERGSSGNLATWQCWGIVDEDAFGIPIWGWGAEDGMWCGCEATGGNGGVGVMGGWTTWIGIFGLLIIMTLMNRGFRGSIIIGMLFIAIISWFRGTEVTYFPDTDAGDARFKIFKQVVGFNWPSKTAFRIFPSKGLGEAGQFILALLTFLYVDILDTTGTLYSMTDFAGMLGEDGDFEGSTAAFTSDAIGTVVGSVLGTSPVTTYIESGAGIQEGGKTGLTAVVISLCFFLSLFFYPIFMSFPPWSTGPALIVVGCLMMRGVMKINWMDFEEAFPAALTIMMMPFSYSIAYGIISGYVAYFFMMVTGLVFDYLGIPKVGVKENENISKQKVIDDASKPGVEMEATEEIEIEVVGDNRL